MSSTMQSVPVLLIYKDLTSVATSYSHEVQMVFKCMLYKNTIIIVAMLAC